MKTNRGRSEWFKTKSKVRPGNLIAPTLFNITMSEICLEIKKKMKKKRTKILVYAYDVMLWTNNVNELEENKLIKQNNI